MEKIAHNHKLIIFGIQLICKFMIFLKKRPGSTDTLQMDDLYFDPQI